MKTFNFFEKLWEHSRTLRRVGLVLVMCLITITQAWADYTATFRCVPALAFGASWSEGNLCKVKYAQWADCSGEGAFDFITLDMEWKGLMYESGGNLYKIYEVTYTKMPSDGAKWLHYERWEGSSWKQNSDQYNDWKNASWWSGNLRTSSWTSFTYKTWDINAGTTIVWDAGQMNWGGDGHTPQIYIYKSGYNDGGNNLTKIGGSQQYYKTYGSTWEGYGGFLFRGHSDFNNGQTTNIPTDVSSSTNIVLFTHCNNSFTDGKADWQKVSPAYKGTSGTTVYFDNTVTGWSKVYLKYGSQWFNRSVEITDNVVPGTNGKLFYYTLEQDIYYGKYMFADGYGYTNYNDIDDSHCDHYTALQASHISGATTLIPTANAQKGATTVLSGYERTVTISSYSHGTVTVSYTDAGNTARSKTSGNFNVQQACVITVSAVADEGYRLTGLTIGGDTHSSGDTYAVRANTTVTATFTANTYNVRFNANDSRYVGTASGSMSNQSHTYGSSKALTSNGFSLANHEFLGWATTPTGAVAYDDEQSVTNLSSTQGATVDLYAVWGPLRGKFFKFEVGNSGSTGNICSAGNDPVSITTSNYLSTLEGGTLKGSVSGTTSYNNLVYTTSNAIGYISYKNDTKGYLQIDLSCPLKTGDVIKYRSIGSSSSRSNYLRHTASNRTSDQITLPASYPAADQMIELPSDFNDKSTLFIVANANSVDFKSFEIIRPYTVTLDASTNGGKVNSKNTDDVETAGTKYFPRAVKSGYRFLGWFESSSGGDPVDEPYTPSGTSDITLYAQFESCPLYGTVFSLGSVTSSTAITIPACSDAADPNYMDLRPYATITGGSAYSGNNSISGAKGGVTASNQISINGENAFVRIDLDCALATGDTLRVTTGKDLHVTTSYPRATTYTISSSTGYYICPVAFNGETSIYIWKKSSDTQITAISVKRPCMPPTIGSQPSNTSICAGSTATLTVGSISSGSGSGTYTYQWYDASNDTEMSTGTGYNTASFTTPTLNAAASYYCIVSETGGCDAKSSTASVSMKTATAVSFSDYTLDATVDESFEITGITAEGAGDKSYKWYSYTSSGGDGEDEIDGETGSTYSFTPDATGDYYFKCEVTADCGSVKSSMITVTVADAGYEVTYKANNSTAESDVVQTDATFDDNPSFTAPSTKAFAGWNTKADGSGTHYDVGDAVPSAITVYAEWWYKVYYIASSTSESNDITAALEDAKFAVSVKATTGTSYNASDYSDYALVVLSESLDGSNAGTDNHELKVIVGLDKPILNLKTYFYGADGDASKRWKWGAPNAGKKPKCIYVKNSKYANLTSHPIYSGLTPDGSDSIQILKTPLTTKPIQPIGSFESGKEGYTLALVPNKSSGSGTAIHEMTAEQRSTATGETITSKYLMISIQSGELSNLSDGGKKLIKNAANYLVTGSQWVPQYKITHSAASDGSYTIQVGAGSATSDDTMSAAGTTITLDDDPDSGFELDSWTVTGDVSGDNITVTSNQFIMPAEAVTVAATFVRSGFTLTNVVNTEGYGTVSPASVADIPSGTATSTSSNTYTVNGTTVTATPAATTAQYTYAFSSWSGLPETVTENATVTANFTRTPVSYTLTWDVNGGVAGSCSGCTTGTVAYGTTLVAPGDPTRDGYDFAGWSPTPAAAMPAENTTYTAQWAEQFTVTYNPMEGSVTPNSATGSSVNPVTLLTPTHASYSFLGWYNTAGTKVGDADEEYTPTADITLYAKWQGACAGGGSTTVFSLTSITGAGSNLSASQNVGASYDASSYCTLNSGSGAYVCACSSSGSLSNVNVTYNDNHKTWTFGGSKVFLALYSATGFKAGDVITWVEGENNTYSPNFAYASAASLADLKGTDYNGSSATYGLTMTSVTAPASGNSYTYTGTLPSGFVSSNWLIVYRTNQSFKLKSITVTRSGGSCYYVTYDGNGATSGYVNDPSQYTSGADPKVLDCGYTRTGYAFMGWADGTDHRDAGTVDYQPGDIIEDISSDVTLYAIWKQIKYFTTEGNWNTSGNWSPSGVPAITDPVVIQANVTVDINNAEALSVDIESGNTLTIGAGMALIIEKTLTKAGGATEAADVIINSTRDEGVGALIIGSEAGDNVATMNFETKAILVGGSTVNQFIGSPFSNAAPYVDYGQQLYKFCPKQNGDRGWWQSHTSLATMTPFWGYNVLCTETSFLDLNWTGKLNPSESKTITDFYYNGSSETDNMFANSWTAPIHVGAFEDGDFVNASTTLYMFNAGTPAQEAGNDGSNAANNNSAPGTYIAIPIHSATYAGIGVIPSMQAFYVLSTGSGASITLDYNKIVYTPALTSVGIVANRAPKHNAEVVEPEVIKLHVQSETGWGANTYVLGRADFAEGYEDGWDGAYIEGESATPKLYTPSIDGNMFINCLPEIEGTVVGFRKGSSDNNYIFSFDYNGDEVWYLNDQKAQKSTQIMNGQTYAFESEAGDNAARFVISATPINKIATGCESVGAEAAKVRKLIINDKVYIIRGGQVFDVLGKTIKK